MMNKDNFEIIDHTKQNNKNESTEKTYNFLTQTKGEIRRVNKVKEIFDNNIESKYIQLICEDEKGNQFVLKDKNLEEEYSRGDEGIFTLQIVIEEKYKGKTKVNLINFEKV